MATSLGTVELHTDAVELRRAWSQTFVSGQEKLIAAERMLPLVHLLPHYLLDPEQLGSSTVCEVLVVSLLWSEGSVPQDGLERVLVCAPPSACGENQQLEIVGLSLYGNGGGDGQAREMVGDCNGALLLLPPTVLPQLHEGVSAFPPRRVITFSEHAEGGTPRSAEAFNAWAMADGIETKNMVYLDVDSDVLRAWVSGQPLENDVFLSAAEDDMFEGDQLRAWQVLSQQPPLLPTLGSRAKPGAKSCVTSPARRGAGTAAASVAGSHTLGGLGQSAGRGSLLVEQQAQGLAQRMRESKAKATAKSQEVGELASALLQGMQQLGERLGRLEDAQKGVAPPMAPPPPLPGRVAFGSAPQSRPGIASARPIASACAGAGPQFGANVGSGLNPRGLLSPREGA
eukprot:973154-Amphidinium_carterae.2